MHIATNDIMHYHITAGLNEKTYHILATGIHQLLRFLFTKRKRIAHLHSGRGVILEVLHRGTLGIKLLGSIKSHIGLTVVKELTHILAINVPALTLAIGTIFTSYADTLIKGNAKPTERFLNIFLGSRNKACGVRIFNSEY